MASKLLKVRYQRTLRFILESDQIPQTILDLGEQNLLSRLLQRKGFRVENTDFNLDEYPKRLQTYERVDAVTAFEILEHLLNPLDVLRNLNTNRLFTTVPLRLWFDTAYRNPDDPRDRHFHEFEDWQFDWLLDRAGWEIVRKEKWNGPVFRIGIRPLLRLLTPRYYAIEAKRK